MAKHKSKIETVLFDLGGTLIKTTGIPRVLKRVLENRGIYRSLEDITEAWKMAEKELDFRDLTILLDEFWIQWNLHILKNLEITSKPRALAEFIATHWWDYCEVSLYPDAEKILPMLKKRGLKVGVVTNGLRSDVAEIFSKVKLQRFFDIVVVIDTLKKMKPDVEVFLYALKMLNTAASNSLFVGDEIETDYNGAQRSGLHAFLIDREGKIHDKSLNRISSLEDLIRLDIIQ